SAGTPRAGRFRSVGPDRRGPGRSPRPAPAVRRRARSAISRPRRSPMATPAVTEQQVLEALRPIIDPDFGRSIVDLGFVKNLRIDGARVSFDIELTTPACPVKAEFERAAPQRAAALGRVRAEP